MQRQLRNSSPREHMKILYVEDNDDNVYMLKNRLSRAGFTVIVAIDGTQGLTMATSEQPDLILMDLTLPDIDGKEATRRIKADPATKSIPVIALTAHAMAGGQATGPPARAGSLCRVDPSVAQSNQCEFSNPVARRSGCRSRPRATSEHPEREHRTRNRRGVRNSGSVRRPSAAGWLRSVLQQRARSSHCAG